MSRAETIETLEQAAQLIERDGWCRFAFRGNGGGYCVMGAVYEVLGVLPIVLGKVSFVDSWKLVENESVLSAIEAITRETYARGAFGPSSWNDYRCSGAEQAAEFLRASKEHVW